jgi:hypothetical protein
VVILFFCCHVVVFFRKRVLSVSGMSKYGFHRVLSGSTTPQAADQLDVSTAQEDTVLDVFMLNLDSTSAAQLHKEAKEKGVSEASLIQLIVNTRGKVRSIFCFLFFLASVLST